MKFEKEMSLFPSGKRVKNVLEQTSILKIKHLWELKYEYDPSLTDS